MYRHVHSDTECGPCLYGKAIGWLIGRGDSPVFRRFPAYRSLEGTLHNIKSIYNHKDNHLKPIYFDFLICVGDDDCVR